LVGDEDMIIGYSYWGFLGPGITDTPDGGRSHRSVLLDGLISRSHQLLLLQANRDLHEAGHDLTGRYSWRPGLPDIDALFLEWRWPIPGRNDTPCGTPGHTCDLYRQDELLAHYTRRGVRTLIWDKDQQLPADDPLRLTPHVTICEAALLPRPGATRLLFPVDSVRLDAADPADLVAQARDLPLVYVGNQYDRDDAFTAYFAPAAAEHDHVVAGKWTDTGRWPYVHFTGRVPFADGQALHRRALTTVQLLPPRYAATGQFTQRLPEAVLNGCLPLTPADAQHATRVVPPELIVHNGAAASAAISTLRRIAGSPAHAELLRACLDGLEVYRLAPQLDILDALLGRPDPASHRHAVSMPRDGAPLTAITDAGSTCATAPPSAHGLRAEGRRAERRSARLR
jgi:hypothetical protein